MLFPQVRKRWGQHLPEFTAAEKAILKKSYDYMGEAGLGGTTSPAECQQALCLGAEHAAFDQFNTRMNPKRHEPRTSHPAYTAKWARHEHLSPPHTCTSNQTTHIY